MKHTLHKLLILLFLFGFTMQSASANTALTDKQLHATLSIITNFILLDTVSVAPTFTNESNISINENNSSALTLNLNSPNTPITYAISDGNSTLFDLNTTTGVVTFLSPPNYESGNILYTFTVTATDSKGDEFTQEITIHITNIVDVVATLVGLSTDIDEIIPIGTTVATVVVSDSGDTAITAFDLNESDIFEIDANGVITTKAIVDYETKSFYTLEVNATNGAGFSIGVDVNITINDVNISSAVYDDNSTTNTNDDVLNIYLSKDVNASHILADDDSFILNPTQTIVITSEEYNNSWSKYTIHFDAGSEILKDTNISLNAGVETAMEIEQINKFSRIKTGQTTSYNDYDDANLSRGITQAYTDNSNGTITDNNTALIWQQEDDNNTYTHADAISYCEDLYLGSSEDWRLPTIDELVSLTDKGRTNPAINPLFTNTNTSLYWSFSSYAFNSSRAWGVNFSNGSGYDRNKTDSYYVRCVRDGQ